MAVSFACRTNAWHRLGSGPDGVTSTVSVVIPAKDPGDGLGRLIASLDRQTFPRSRMQVIVVDDGSDPPLTLPEGIEVIRQVQNGRFGAGRARNTGAAAAEGDVLLFIDSDMLLEAEAVERLVRWRGRSPAAVVTATIGFFDPEAVGLDRLEAAIEDRGLTDLLGPATSDDQSWRENTFRRTFDLTVDAPDLFRATVGAVMCVPRALHQAIGGLRELGMRGIEDTEYGFRLHNAGGLFVLDREVQVWHQGRRFFDSKGADRAKRERQHLIEELIPVAAFRRRPRAGMQVPVAIVESTVPGAAVVGFAATSRPDVVMVAEADGDRVVAAEAMPVIDRDAALVRLVVDRKAAVSAATVDLVLERIVDLGIGVLHLLDDHGKELVTVTTNRACGRVSLEGANGADPVAEAGRRCGEWWLPAEDFGISPV